MTAIRTQVLAHTDIAPEVWDNVIPADRRSPKQLYDWAHAMALAYSRNEELRVLVAGTPAAPDALVPLIVTPTGLRRHHFVANDDGGLSFPYRDPSVLPDLAAALVRIGVPIDLGYYPAADPVLGEIERASRGRAIVVQRPQEIPAAPWLDLDATWEDPIQHMKRNLRQSIRRNGRRFDEMGEVKLEFLEPAEEEIDALLDIAVEVEGKSWKDRTGTALVHDRRQQEFFRLYAKTAARAGRFHISIMSLDEKPVAISLGEIYNNIYWAYKIGYDEAFSKIGPGVLLQYHLTSHLAGRGLSRIEFQGQLVEYKRNWTDKAVETTAVRIYPFTPRGVAAIGYDAMHQGLKKYAARREAAARRNKTPSQAKPAEPTST